MMGVKLPLFVQKYWLEGAGEPLDVRKITRLKDLVLCSKFSIFRTWSGSVKVGVLSSGLGGRLTPLEREAARNHMDVMVSNLVLTV
jgi:hypothetical protein